jgi:hypothetical protein
MTRLLMSATVVGAWSFFTPPKNSAVVRASGATAKRRRLERMTSSH